jgi:hypothetical protein
MGPDRVGTAKRQGAASPDPLRPSAPVPRAARPRPPERQGRLSAAGFGPVASRGLLEVGEGGLTFGARITNGRWPTAAGGGFANIHRGSGEDGRRDGRRAGARGGSGGGSRCARGGKAAGVNKAATAPSRRVAALILRAKAGRDSNPRSPGAPLAAGTGSMEGSFISREASASGNFASISLESAIPPVHLAKQRELKHSPTMMSATPTQNVSHPYGTTTRCPAGPTQVWMSGNLTSR